MARPLAVALVHFPVLDRAGAEITTTVTNLDVHDLSRSARTYGCAALYVVTPIASQRALVERLCGYWTGDGRGKRRIPDREAAISSVIVTGSLDEARRAHGDAELWVTAARGGPRAVSFAEARGRLAGEGPSVLLTFGTGWGLSPRVLSSASAQLEPIRGAADYNHLSVRAACAIALDRLVSVP